MKRDPSPWFGLVAYSLIPGMAVFAAWKSYGWVWGVVLGLLYVGTVVGIFTRLGRRDSGPRSPLERVHESILRPKPPALATIILLLSAGVLGLGLGTWSYFGRKDQVAEVSAALARLEGEIEFEMEFQARHPGERWDRMDELQAKMAGLVKRRDNQIFGLLFCAAIYFAGLLMVFFGLRALRRRRAILSAD